MNKLYASIPNVSYIENIAISEGHDSAATTAVVTAESTTLGLGDTITIDLGYEDDHGLVFTGIVKQLERSIPEDKITITAYDNMVRAQDYFIAASDPSSPLTFRDVEAGDLVTQLMGLAGLDTDTVYTYFTLGINNSFEVNLVSVYDYCRMISDMLTWSIWADTDGVIQFKNRKPYPMMADDLENNTQPNWVSDIPTSYVLTPDNILGLTYSITERLLRNRVVVYGNGSISAEASEESTVLPLGFYKSAVLAYPQLITTTELAQSIAEYNLNLFHRFTEAVNVSVIGDRSLHARQVIDSDYSDMNVTGLWYIYGCDTDWGQQGYSTTLELRRMVRANL